MYRGVNRKSIAASSYMRFPPYFYFRFSRKRSPVIVFGHNRRTRDRNLAVPKPDIQTGAIFQFQVIPKPEVSVSRPRARAFGARPKTLLPVIRNRKYKVAPYFYFRSYRKRKYQGSVFGLAPSAFGAMHWAKDPTAGHTENGSMRYIFSASAPSAPRLAPRTFGARRQSTMPRVKLLAPSALVSRRLQRLGSRL